MKWPRFGGPRRASLLRVLQERRFERLGGTETLRIEARLMALTNVDLPAAVSAGRFREDLFFRMNVLTIACRFARAPGRHFTAGDHFLSALCLAHARNGVQLSDGSRSMLTLRVARQCSRVAECAERAVVFTRVEVLEPEHFAENPGGCDGQLRNDRRITVS